MTRKFAINVIGYVEDELDRYDKDAIHTMLNRQDIAMCFAPLKVVEVVVQSMKQEHRIKPSDVTTKKLSQV